LTSKRLLDSLTRQALARIGNSAPHFGRRTNRTTTGRQKTSRRYRRRGARARNIIDDHTGVNEVFAHASDHQEQGDEQRDLS
jgi:hypothetical protein